MTTVSIPRKAMLALASVAVGLAACANDAGSDKSGGQANVEPVTLVMAQPNHEPPEQLVSWAKEVGRLSGGTLTIEFENLWRDGQPGYEAGTIEDVQQGTVDLAWVGARAFDNVDVNRFQALVAPMLIDSHDLQAAVFDAGIPAKMIDGLDELDVGIVGIGVLPGPMRKVLGIDHPYTTSEHFSGALVGIQQSSVAKMAMAAVGAKTKDLPTGADLDGVDAYEQQFESINGNQYWQVANHVTANVNLWPRPLVMFMNEDAFEALDDGQQEALRAAATAAVPAALEASRGEDHDGAAELCTAGRLSIEWASDDDLNALRSAFEPVYEELSSDPATSGYLDAISALKDETGAAPDGPDRAECTALAPASDAAAQSPIDGVYEVTTTADDLRAAGDDSPPLAENWGDWTYVFDRGRFAFTQENEEACTWAYGTYEIDGEQVAWSFVAAGGDAPNDAMNRPGEGFTFGWSLYKDKLSLTAVSGEISPEPYRALPWRLTSTTPSAEAFGTRCPPPPEAFAGEEDASDADAGAFPLGRFEVTITADDEGAVAHDVEGTFTMVIDRGVLQLLEPGGAVGFEADYTVFRDRIEATGREDAVTATWAFDGEHLTFEDVTPSDSPYEVVWASQPWKLVSDG